MHRNANRRPRRLARARRLALGLTLTTTATAQACAAKDEAPAASAEQAKADPAVAAATPTAEEDGEKREEKADRRADSKSASKSARPSPPAGKRKDRLALSGEFDPLGGEEILEESGVEQTETAKPNNEPDASSEPVTVDGDPTDEERLSPEAQARMLFEHYGVGPTIATAENPISTFAIDVDTASYSVLRAHLLKNELPPEAAVRVEEVVNYFDYHYAPPETGDFSLHAEVVPSPQRKGYHVLHLGIKAKEVAKKDRPAANLVFVIDVSGSMRGDRLSTVKKSLAMLVDQLRADDSVGIVAYGGKAEIILEPTPGSDRKTILSAVERLKTGGSTNLQQGLELGYELAAKAKVGATINRVVLCSDGVANTGATTADAILKKVAEHAGRGITISSIGVGMGGYNDALMEKLADKGNGNYAYVDGLSEARRVFVDHLTGTLQVIAKDVKVQVEFDEEIVSRYRLLGYENRGLTARDFDDDTKDAGEIGAGHTVTALYEVKIDDEGDDGEAPSLGTLRVRYKKPRGTQSELIERPLPGTLVRSAYTEAAPPTRLSMVAAAYAEKLRGSYWVRNLTWQEIEGMYDQIDPELRGTPEVAELGRLIKTAAKLDDRGDAFEAAAPLARMDFDRVPVLR